MIKVSQGKN